MLTGIRINLFKTCSILSTVSKTRISPFSTNLYDPEEHSAQEVINDNEDAGVAFDPTSPEGIQIQGSSSPAININTPSTAVYAFPDECLHSPHPTGIEAFHKASFEPFPTEIRAILSAPVDQTQIQMKPDGCIYLPEIHYRQILMKSFGPGGWALIPRGPHTIIPSTISVLTREYALFCLGRFVSLARGSAILRTHMNSAALSEAVRSNALMRCCKDLGIASELWDPTFVSKWKSNYYAQRQQSQPRSFTKWDSNSYKAKPFTYGNGTKI
jgi:hypothetical protein